MTVLELMYMSLIMLGLVALRFGIPFLLMWVLGRLLSVFASPAA